MKRMLCLGMVGVLMMAGCEQPPYQPPPSNDTNSKPAPSASESTGGGASVAMDPKTAAYQAYDRIKNIRDKQQAKAELQKVRQKYPQYEADWLALEQTKAADDAEALVLLRQELKLRQQGAESARWPGEAWRKDRIEKIKRGIGDIERTME